MKKCISIILAVVIFVFMAVSASAEGVVANTSGYSGVEFSNGYVGFCIDANLKGAQSGQDFTQTSDTSSATNNNDQNDVSQILKALFVVNFNEMFGSDGNGGYKLDDLKVDSSIQSAVWNITDGRYIWGESKTFAEAARAYDGPEIPDEGHSIQLENGDVVTFSFVVFEPHVEGCQAFFALKVSVSDEPTHTHDYGDNWKSDDENHWHECGCGDKADEDEHSPTDADCVNPSKCEVCGKELGGVNPEKHTGETVVKNQKPATEFDAGYTGDIHCADCDELLEKGEAIKPTHTHDYGDNWKSDDENHWRECGCGDKADEDEHSPTDADCVNSSKCEVCGKELGGVNPEKHTGETVVKNQKPATEFDAGYTGDIHCADCDELLEKGEAIKPTHTHDYGDNWKSDDENHWHECGCGDKADEDSHSFVLGTCGVCGYGNSPVTPADVIYTCGTVVVGTIDSLNGVDFGTVDFGNIDFGDINFGGTDTDNGKNDDAAVDEEINTEIPDTGSDTTVAWAIALLVLSICAIAVTEIRRRKNRAV